MPLPSGLLTNGSAKENDGRRMRRRFLLRGAVWLVLSLAAYRVLVRYWLAGVNIPDVEVDKKTGQKRIRRRPDQLKKRDHRTGKDVPTSALDGIMEGHLTLINIKIPYTGLISDGDQKYTNVQAKFCAITWKLQEDDPSKVPMFKDLQQQSQLCEGTIYKVDLWDVARKATDYDNRNHTFAATAPKKGQGPVKPTAVVFHETRCGSTLIANLLASFKPKHTRVYSESPPPVTALRACEEEGTRCDAGAQEALIRDVFYMMGRTTRPEQPQYVFYKIQSVGVRSIHAFTNAMPNTPWLFVYRDSIEIMMSHFKNYQKGNPLSKDFMPVCLRSYGKQRQHPLLKELVEAKGTTIEQLSKEEYCAAHLASLSESAVREYEFTKDSSTPRWFVNYNELPHRIWETVLPQVLGTDVTTAVDKDMIERMSHVSHSYSKGRGKKARNWHEDSTLKQGRAPNVVKQAAARFLDPVFAKMEAIRKDNI